MLSVGVVSLFPEMLDALTGYGISGRAFRQGLVSLRCWNPRSFTSDRHQTVDDRPYGGGPGMLMMAEPVRDAIRAAREGVGGGKVIYLSPAGRRLDMAGVAELAGQQRLVFVAGRYEGLDQRVIDAEVDEEWSIGDYVLSGGELAVMVVLDAVIRQLPGALGHVDSAAADSFSDGLLEFPQYTRPEVLDGVAVPEVLLSGHHGEIARWRRMQALGRTWLRRPELLAQRTLSADDARLLELFRQQWAGRDGAAD